MKIYDLKHSLPSHDIHTFRCHIILWILYLVLHLYLIHVQCMFCLRILISQKCNKKVPNNTMQCILRQRLASIIYVMEMFSHWPAVNDLSMRIWVGIMWLDKTRFLSLWLAGLGKPLQCLFRREFARQKYGRGYWFFYTENLACSKSG